MIFLTVCLFPTKKIKNYFLNFFPNFYFSRVIYRILKSWETDKLKNKFFLETDKLVKIMFNFLKYASECQMDAIFSIKFLEAFAEKLPNRTVL